MWETAALVESPQALRMEVFRHAAEGDHGQGCEGKEGAEGKQHEHAARHLAAEECRVKFHDLRLD